MLTRWMAHSPAMMVSFLAPPGKDEGAEEPITLASAERREADGTLQHHGDLETGA